MYYTIYTILYYTILQLGYIVYKIQQENKRHSIQYLLDFGQIKKCMFDLDLYSN